MGDVHLSNCLSPPLMKCLEFLNSTLILYVDLYLRSYHTCFHWGRPNDIPMLKQCHAEPRQAEICLNFHISCNITHLCFPLHHYIFCIFWFLKLVLSLQSCKYILYRIRFIIYILSFTPSYIYTSMQDRIIVISSAFYMFISIKCIMY